MRSGAEGINPYGGRGPKEKEVEQMFDSIAPAYDFMNTAMSFGLHRRWREKALGLTFDTPVLAAKLKSGENVDILDVATGTGDVAFRLAEIAQNGNVTGVDLSAGMLEIARRKLKEMGETRNRMKFETGDCLSLQYSSDSFDLVTVAYGVRNFSGLLQGLKEMYRVLRTGGTLCIIELSRPESLLPRIGYDIYSRWLIPTVGRLVSGDKSAYTYLPKSIAAAPQRGELTDMMKEAGFKDCHYKSLTFGAVTIYLAHK
ncbi:MAG: bifunctional demethylmenaquinone methyltransferase/2-methoxy-6-polyprenyl-1,4-benzoquinol methylase UbiE [Muribaculaceae bacterium]|nr:bifunctional demethylmenaquinone methyltransferase/2-methoxy-6-polyprenyl-1,4-benzoquinol methylase UbiE [Muribaculaceae bacterium]